MRLQKRFSTPPCEIIHLDIHQTMWWDDTSLLCPLFDKGRVRSIQSERLMLHRSRVNGWEYPLGGLDKIRTRNTSWVGPYSDSVWSGHDMLASESFSGVIDDRVAWAGRIAVLILDGRWVRLVIGDWPRRSSGSRLCSTCTDCIHSGQASMAIIDQGHCAQQPVTILPSEAPL